MKSLWKAKRNPVILILDPEVQGLPWESLPLMRRCKQPVSRVPSLPLLYSLWSAHTGLRPAWSTPAWPRTASSTSSTRTITSRTLQCTEKILEGALRSLASWEGVVGKAHEKQ